MGGGHYSMANPLGASSQNVGARNNGFFGSGFNRSTLGNLYQHSGIGPAVGAGIPQFSGQNMHIGGQSFNMLDPRMLLTASMAGNPFIAAPMLAYTAARQYERNRYNKKVEQQMMPVAENQALQAQQAAQFGGIRGGMAGMMNNNAFQAILQQIAQMQKAYAEQQDAMESKATLGLTPLASGGLGK